MSEIQPASQIKLQPGTQVKSDVAAKKVFQEFEALFIHQLFKTMRSSLNASNDLFGGGSGQQIYQDMLDEQFSKAMAERGGIGLSPLLYRQSEQILGKTAPKDGSK